MSNAMDRHRRRPARLAARLSAVSVAALAATLLASGTASAQSTRPTAPTPPVQAGGVKWTIKQGIVFDAAALRGRGARHGGGAESPLTDVVGGDAWDGRSGDPRTGHPEPMTHGR